MVLSDVFDTYPRLKIILGHLGEGLPFLLWRINTGARRRRAEMVPRHLLRAFLDHDERVLLRPALFCCVQEMGVDRILFSVDYPFVDNAPGTEVHRIPLCAEDKQESPQRQCQAPVEDVNPTENQVGAQRLFGVQAPAPNLAAPGSRFRGCDPIAKLGALILYRSFPRKREPRIPVSCSVSPRSLGRRM